MAGGSKANLNPAVWLHRLSSQLLLRGHMHQVDEMVRTEVREPPTESAASHAYPMCSGASFFCLFCFVLLVLLKMNKVIIHVHLMTVGAYIF